MTHDFFRMSGEIKGSLADLGATPEQVEALKANVCGPLVLSASELADRIEILPPECGGREAAAALRMLDPDTKITVTPEGPLTLGNSDCKRPWKD